MNFRNFKEIIGDNREFPNFHQKSVKKTIDNREFENFQQTIYEFGKFYGKKIDNREFQTIKRLQFWNFQENTRGISGTLRKKRLIVGNFQQKTC